MRQNLQFFGIDPTCFEYDGNRIRKRKSIPLYEWNIRNYQLDSCNFDSA